MNFIMQQTHNLEIKFKIDSLPIHYFRHFSSVHKVLLITGASGIIIGILAHFMKRKKISQNDRKITTNTKAATTSTTYTIRRNSRESIISRTYNGDIVSLVCSSKRSVTARSCYSESNGKVVINSGKISITTKSNADVDENDLNDNTKEPSLFQLGEMGMKTLEATIDCWSRFIELYESDESDRSIAGLKPEEIDFLVKLKTVISQLEQIKEEVTIKFNQSKRIFSDEFSECSSDCDSFESAQDTVADLRDFDQYNDLFPNIDNLPLYRTGLVQHEQNLIPVRKMRTDIVHCTSDAEYTVKLYCIRLAFEFLFKKFEVKKWLETIGTDIFVSLFELAEKSSIDFRLSLKNLIDFVDGPLNWASMQDELKYRGVHSFTFYDIVLDYIILDAFEDLDAPPYTVITVLNNQWLSNSFKECAMSSAIWSMLKMKRKRLKVPNGFMAHFYTLSEQIIPLMAWGFLGPEGPIKDCCFFFKQQILEFLIDLFSFEKCRFSTVEDLAYDIFNLMESRAIKIQAKFH